MKGADRIILLALPLLALVVGFYLLVLSPKMKEASELQERIDAANSAIATAEAEVTQGEAARAAFPNNYADLVSLGAAAPENEDQASLINNLTELAQADSVSLRKFSVRQGGSATAPAAPAAPVTSTEPSTTEPAPTVPVAATETAAASLPIGATVGPAGLPVTPYEVTYFGEFFDMADLFASLDERVQVTEDGTPARVDGRLITIDGFTMKADPVSGFPRVQTDLVLTTYLVPPEQGISAGATPAGPAPIGSPDAPVPVSTDPGAAPASTAAVTP